MLMLPPNAVTLLDGPLASTRNTALDYTLALDPQRLVAPYRRESGLPLLAPSYGNWENSGLDGHTLGHVLSALAYASVTHTPRSAEARERLEWLVAQVQECQAAVGTGYVGGIPQGRALWERIGNGDVDADSFGLHGAWVPWYNLHKVFAGLVDAGWVAGVAVARDVVVGLANWWLRVAARLRDEQFQAMLVTEFGAINGAFADLAVHTGDARYLEMAKRFTDRALFDALVAGEDPLVGLHANTQIAKALGWARVALAGGGREYLVAARRVWDVVVRDHTLSFGGNSVREHCAGDPWAPFVSEQGPESCNTHNMLRLTGALLELGESPRPLVDFVEVALMNHVVSSVHPEGGFVYFTPARPQHYRVYSQVHECFWCCVGTGMEHLMKNGELVYSP